jgi:hypothetical protein
MECRKSTFNSQGWRLIIVDAPKIWKPELGIRKPRGSDIEWSNPWGD